MKIERWFKGPTTCQAGTGLFTLEPGEEMAHCLWTQLTYDGLESETTRLAEIIRRHFSSRLTCRACEWSDILAVIHWNNHNETTREDVDKVMQIFTEEQGA